jgi:diguanylate cyclase (GGDEF)-like protein
MGLAQGRLGRWFSGLVLRLDSGLGDIVKQKSVKSKAKPLTRRQARALPRRSGDQKATVQTPQAVKPRPRAAAARLLAEVERLAAELEASRARLSDLEGRIDVDPLTETLNRRGFERELKRSLAYVKRYAANATLIYLDLDEFKPVNDRHGHAAGDAVLKAIAAALVREVRACDVVARIGGDEFAVLLWNLPDADAVAKAVELEQAVYATPVRWGASTMVVGASAGVAFVGPLDASADVLARADAAMYARKTEKRARHSGSRAAAIRNP